MKTVLAFETSGPVLSVALGTRNGEVVQLSRRGALLHSEYLIPLVDRLLKKKKLKLENIDAFAIDRGPGSFTGLRIGFSLLKGFLAVRKRACYGALSLDMISDRAKGSRLGVLRDARREKIYARFYRRQKGNWVAEKKLEVLSYSEFMARITRETRLVGDPLTRYGGKPKVRPAFPSAATLVRWFQARDPRLSPLRAPKDLLPLYFRASEAEEKRRPR